MDITVPAGATSGSKALSADGTPSFFTVLKLFKARGLRVHFQSVAV